MNSINQMIISFIVFSFTTVSFAQEQVSATTCVISFSDTDFNGPESTSYPNDSYDIYVHAFPNGEPKLNVVGGLTTTEADVRMMANSFAAFVEAHYGVKSTIECKDTAH